MVWVINGRHFGTIATPSPKNTGLEEPGDPLKGGLEEELAIPLFQEVSYGPLVPRAPNVALLRAFWSLFDGIWGLLKGSWGVLVWALGFFKGL